MIDGYYIKVEIDDVGDEHYKIGEVHCEQADVADAIRGVVGGWIEAIPTNEKISIFVNEEGKCSDPPLPRNGMAELFWQPFDMYHCMANGDWISGNVAIFGPATRSGKTTSAPAGTLDLIKSLCGL